jgi:hypothetical protein
LLIRQNESLPQVLEHGFAVVRFAKLGRAAVQ